MEVSVVIPCFRCAATLERAFESVLGQSLAPREVILVDDASDDDTREVMHRLSSGSRIPTRVLGLDVNSGPGVARNHGWDMASGELVAFLDADDAWHSEKLDRVCRVADEHPSASIIGHRAGVRIGDWQDEPRVIRDDCVRSIGKARILRGNAFPTSGTTVRREVRERFARRLRAEDYELWMRIILAGGEALLIDRELAYHYKRTWGDSGLTEDLGAMERGELEAFDSLRRDGLLGAGTCAVVKTWSYAKHVRRLVLSGGRRIRRVGV